MFIYTQDEALVELSGSVRADTTASYTGKYRVVVTRRGCMTTLAEYNTKEEAKAAVSIIAFYLEKEKPICWLTSETMDETTQKKLREKVSPYHYV